MDIYLKVTASILIAAIMTLVLSKQSKDISLLLTIAVSCLVLVAAFSYLHPVLDFAYRIIELGEANSELFDIILKSVGIGLISQIAGLVCVDAGNQSLAKALQIMTIVVILCLSVPILEQMLLLLETIMGEL